MNYQETARTLAKRAMTHPDPAMREKLRLLSAAAALLEQMLAKAESFARRAQHYEQMAQFEPEGSRRQRELLLLAGEMQRRCSQSAPQNSLRRQDCTA